MPKPAGLKNLKALHMSIVGGILFVNPELGSFVLSLVLSPATLFTESSPAAFQSGYFLLALIVLTIFEGRFPRRVSAALWGVWGLFWMYWAVEFLATNGTVWSNMIFWLPHLGMSVFAGAIGLKTLVQLPNRGSDSSSEDAA